MQRFLARSIVWILCAFAAPMSFAQVDFVQARWDLSGNASCPGCATAQMIVEVENIAYEKIVEVTYQNNITGTWRTQDAFYVGPSQGNREYWELLVSAHASGGDTIPFAVAYHVDGETYWDNNNGNDYAVYFGGDPQINDVSINHVVVNPFLDLPEPAGEDQMSWTKEIFVRNLGPEKSVVMRYTTDGWETWEEAPGEFTRFAYTPGWEYWTVEAILPRDVDDDDVEYAISYTANGETYWDNNLGRNYKFQQNF